MEQQRLGNPEDMIVIPAEKLNEIFSSMRGKIFSLFEACLPSNQAEAAKQQVRGITGGPWLRIQQYMAGPEILDILDVNKMRRPQISSVEEGVKVGDK